MEQELGVSTYGAASGIYGAELGLMGQDQNLWGGIESYGAGIYIYRESIGQDQNLWGWIGTCGAELESMGQDWDLWGRVCVPAGVGIPYCGVWGRAAARGGPGNRLGRGCRGGRPAGGQRSEVRGQEEPWGWGLRV